MWDLERREAGFSLLEVIVSLQLLALVVLVLLPLNRLALGTIAYASGAVGYAPVHTEHPARLRTSAAEYVHAELEYLRSRGYAAFAAAHCPLSAEPRPDPVRDVPPDYLGAHEPRIPPGFARARIRVEDEQVHGVAPDGCYPRRITVLLYRTDEDAAAARPFARGAILLSPRGRAEADP
ncbi:MAG: hypothetical protein QN163_10815 [Armatimonadota bacterium]|nr:hypothetical protein [Armatimonadota bacterium]MDR5696544.1 hypothetical protein [Armatimonadota bacterium]